MKKNSCPHCGAWGQLSRFCGRCGNSIIYSSITAAERDFLDKPVAKSTQAKDIPKIILVAVLISIAVAFIL